MNKLYNNRFIFIVSISVIFIMVLGFGSVALVKKNTLEFENAGYIISSNEVLNFASGTTYRLNLNEQIVFTTKDGDIYEVDQSSFVHYQDGAIALLKNGAFVDLKGIGESIVPYYNITKKSLIKFRDGGYTIKNGNNDLYFDDILLRVNDNKYLIAGKDISIKVPGIDGLLEGQYFELTFVEDGIILIENNNDSYQVTADGTIIYVGDKTLIDLSTKNVMYDGEARLNMSQVTIDGNENITIVPDEEESTDSSSESGGTSGDNGSTGGGSGTSDSGNQGGTSGDIKPIPDDTEVSIELVQLLVNVESVTAILQVNNPLKITGDLSISIIDTATQLAITPNYDMTNTGYLSVFSDQLESNKTYMLRIKETRGDDEIEYLQRMFTTETFGISLKKVMISDDEINYDVIFSDESNVEEVNMELYDKDGKLVQDSYKTLTKDNNNVSYLNLDSNSTYTLKIISFKINSATYLNESGYVTKTVKTLKQKPTFKSVKVESNNEGSIFSLSVMGIDDPDSSITKYTYYIYKETDLENVVYSTTATSSTLNVTVGENGIESNTNYRFKALIEYNDNEKVREIETNFSSKFISTGAAVTFVQDQSNTTFNQISGEITLQDPDCTIPMPGREACPGTNSFTVSYYVNGIKRYQDVQFVPTDNPDIFKVESFTITGLSANTQYTMELNGDVYEENEFGERILISQIIIGNPFTATTADIPSLKVEKKTDNPSTVDNPINVTLSLTSNSSSSTFIDQVKTMTVTLYALDVSNNKIQIGNAVNLTSEEIKNLLYNKDYQMTNKFFGIENLDKLLEIAKDEAGWAYINYRIEFTDAYDVLIGEITEESNKIEIENSEVTTSISKSFLLEYYAAKEQATTARVTPLLNKEISVPVEDLEGTTVAAYKIDGSIYVENILRQYYGVTGANNVINWDYVFYIYDEDDNLIYTSDKKKSTTHIFYLDDENIENFDRGNEYKFGFQIIVSDGVYPQTPVIAIDESGNSLFNPIKENPYIAMATWASSLDTITFMYKITKDIDNALYNNSLYIFDAENNLVDTQEIIKSDDYQYVTFNNLSMNNTYKIMYNKANTALEEGYSTISKGAFIFDGYYQLNGTYSLKYEDAGNQLAIIINDDSLLERGAAYDVTVNSASKSKEFVFTKRDLVDCTGNGLSCLMINYHDLEDLQGLNTNVEVKAYYENGLIGLGQTGEYFVFKNDANTLYLTVKENGGVKSNIPFPDGLYTFERKDMDLSIKNHISNYSWKDDLLSANLKLAITTGGVNYSNYGSYNPKEIANVDLTTDNNHFFFSSIIPTVNATHTRKINNVIIDVTQSGLTKTIVENEFRTDDRKIYIDLYADNTYSNPITVSADLDIEDLNKSLSFNFEKLIPAHTYYYQIYAYILNSEGNYVRTELYDYRADGVFEARSKEVSTLNASEIFSKVDASYSSMTTDEKYMTRKIEVNTSLLNYENYKLVYSIKDSDGNNIFEDYEVEDITGNIIFTYDVSDDNFVYGQNGYKLIITAITKDSNAYELVLYNGSFVPHLSTDNGITELRNPTFEITNSSVYVPSGKNSYAIKFVVGVDDPDLVIKNATYYVKVTDDYKNTYAPVGYTLDSEGYISLSVLTDINRELIYEDLNPESYYSITVKAYTYKNNASLSNKDGVADGFDYIETGSEYNLDLGTGSLSVLNNVLTIDYKNASNLNNITKIIASVRKESRLVGTYEFVGSDIDFIHSDGKWKLNIDLSSIATTLNTNDRVRVIIRYYAKNLEGVEGQVGNENYANYTEE